MLPKKSVKSHKCFYPSLHLFFHKNFCAHVVFSTSTYSSKKSSKNYKKQKNSYLLIPPFFHHHPKKTSLMLQTYFFQNHKHLFAFLI